MALSTSELSSSRRWGCCSAPSRLGERSAIENLLSSLIVSATPFTTVPSHAIVLSALAVHHELLDRIRAAVAKVIQGKREAIELLLVAVLAGGHVLVEDVPGVG